MFVVLVLLFISLCQGSTVSTQSKLRGLEATPNPWVPVDWHTLPKALPSDQVEVRLVVAPLLEDTLGNLFKSFDIFHGALAFVNRRTNFSITINYDADDFFHASLFPIIVTYPNGTKDLLWRNKGGDFIYLGINDTFWNQGDYLISVVGGTVYNDFISGYNAQLNDSHQFYNMFTIMDHWDGQVFFQGWDCFEFCWDAFRNLHRAGVQFTVPKLERNFMNLYTANPPILITDLYNNDPTVRKEVIDFYELIQYAVANMTWTEFLWTIVDTLEGEFYVREDCDYWKMQLHWPLVGIDWDYAWLPGYGPQPEEKIPKPVTILPKPVTIN